MKPNRFEEELNRNRANYVPLFPGSFLKRTAAPTWDRFAPGERR